MAPIQQTKVTKAIRLVSGVIATLSIAFVSWFLYAIYALEPSDANTSMLGLLNSTLMVILAVVTTAYARSVWRRSYGIHERPRKLRAFSGFMIIYPILIAVLLPYALVFAMFAFVLQYMNSLFAREFRVDLSN